MTDQPTKPEAPNLLSILKELPGAPDQAVLDKWKAQFGSTYCAGFAEDEIYIYRPLSRREYKTIQIQNQDIAAMTDPKEAMNAQLTSEENTVSMCLLWPKLTPEQLSNDKGGLVSSLLEMIMQASNFLTPQQASMLVMKL